jgi:hypothetical protein
LIEAGFVELGRTDRRFASLVAHSATIVDLGVQKGEITKRRERSKFVDEVSLGTPAPANKMIPQVAALVDKIPPTFRRSFSHFVDRQR